jgi:hypothetical protein
MVTCCRHLSRLQMYDEKLASEGLDISSIAVELPPQAAGGSTGHTNFLQVVARAADDNGDLKLSQNELLALQLKGDKFAKDLDVPHPKDWLTLLDVVFMGFDRAWLLGAASPGGSSGVEAARAATGVAPTMPAHQAQRPSADRGHAQPGVDNAALHKLHQLLQVGRQGYWLHCMMHCGCMLASCLYLVVCCTNEQQPGTAQPCI